MTTTSHAFRSQAILSVRVRSMPAPLIFVVTSDPALMDTVRDLLHRSGDDASIVWLTSVDSACRRLEWDGAAMVVLDDRGEGGTTDAALAALQAAAPGTRVLVLTKNTVES